MADGWKCPHPKCKGKTVIKAWTGLEEIVKIQAHFLRRHKQDLGIEEALNLRAMVEEWDGF